MLTKELFALIVMLAIWVWPIAANDPCMEGDCSSSTNVDQEAQVAEEQQLAWENSVDAFLNSGSGTSQPTFGGGGYGGYPGSYTGSPLNGRIINQNNKLVLQIGRPTQDWQVNPAPSGSILAKAQELANLGDPVAVKTFLASQGYRMDKNWCGDFAAAVVSIAGGRPPKDPQLADNWRNWGTAVDGAPQPGDIAVKIHEKGTHGHVTFVESYDPKTGRFVGLGGNQGGDLPHWRGTFGEDEYTFRR